MSGNHSFGGKRMTKNKLVRLDGDGSLVTAVTLSGEKSMNTDTVGTVDRAIRENNIFTSMANMPDEVQTALLKNGWIGKIVSAGNNTTSK